MEQPPLQSTPVGAFRFNTDSSKLEYYDGNQWVNITSDSPQVQTGGTRGVWIGGASPTNQTTIDYANLDSTGNAIDFGDLSTARQSNGDGGMASRTRGFYARGASSEITFVNFSITGNEIDFGDMANSITNGSSTASGSTRGLIFAGYAAPATLNVIQYITMASSGNGVDFGDLTNTGSSSAVASPTRSVMLASSANRIEYVTISTTGNAADFGDSTISGGHRGFASNAIRAVGLGAEVSPARVNTIEYFTIATLGNAIDYADLVAATNTMRAASTPTRGFFAGGNTGSQTNTIQFISFQTSGTASDFGDLQNTADELQGGCSNGHGGLG